MQPMLTLALWYGQQHTAMLGTVTDAYGAQHADAVEFYGFGLASALASVLADCKGIGARRLLVLCNNPAFVDAFARKVVGTDIYGKAIKHVMLALPTVDKDGIPRGNDNQWNVARQLAHYDKWRIVHADAMPRTKALWEANYASIKKAA